MGDGDRISYGRILSSFACELSADEVEKLVFIYLRDNGNAPVDCNAKGAALRVLMKLERLARFSFEDPAGLIQIATDAGRLDWKKKFEDYVADPSRNPRPKRKNQRRTPLPSDEQEHLEDAHRVVRAKCIAIEEQFNELWSSETVTKEDMLKLLRQGKKLTKEIECELEKGIIKVKGLMRESDSLSSSGSSSSIELSSSPEANCKIWAPQMPSRGERNRDVPLPKPRRPKPPPPYQQAAVQETTRHNSPMLKPSIENSLEAPDQPPPVPPKKQISPRLSVRRQSAMSQMCFNKPSVCIPLQKKESEEELKQVAVEEGDQTGDSGMESGSGSIQHGTITEWREVIRNPPPEPSKNHFYTPIQAATRDEDQLYQDVDRK